MEPINSLALLLSTQHEALKKVANKPRNTMTCQEAVLEARNIVVCFFEWDATIFLLSEIWKSSYGAELTEGFCSEKKLLEDLGILNSFSVSNLINMSFALWDERRAGIAYKNLVKIIDYCDSTAFRPNVQFFNVWSANCSILFGTLFIPLKLDPVMYDYVVDIIVHYVEAANRNGIKLYDYNTNVSVVYSLTLARSSIYILGHLIPRLFDTFEVNPVTWSPSFVLDVLSAFERCTDLFIDDRRTAIITFLSLNGMDKVLKKFVTNQTQLARLLMIPEASVFVPDMSSVVSEEIKTEMLMILALVPLSFTRDIFKRICKECAVQCDDCNIISLYLQSCVNDSMIKERHDDVIDLFIAGNFKPSTEEKLKEVEHFYKLKSHVGLQATWLKLCKLSAANRLDANPQNWASAKLNAKFTTFKWIDSMPTQCQNITKFLFVTLLRSHSYVLPQELCLLILSFLSVSDVAEVGLGYKWF